jgi:hypothetical protein
MTAACAVPRWHPDNIKACDVQSLISESKPHSAHDPGTAFKPIAGLRRAQAKPDAALTMKRIPSLVLMLCLLAHADNAALPPHEPMLDDDFVGALSAGTTVQTRIEIVEVEGMPFTKAVRVTTLQPMQQFYHLQLAAVCPQPVNRADLLLVRFHARGTAPEDETGEARGNVYFQHHAPPDWHKMLSVDFRTTSEWRRYDFPFVAGRDYPAGATALCFGLGYGRQEMEIGGVEFVRMAAGTELKDLPRTAVSYAGSEPDAAWRAAAARIEQHRKGELRDTPAQGRIPELVLDHIRRIDLRPHWNDRVPLENPHKGWYHHYPDNHINKYLIREDADLLEFPGMDHLYLRLAWAYLEPEEGQFDWDVIDRIIEKWVGHGLGIAFRISCRETSTDRIEQQFATPRWVKEAGARGGFYRSGQEVGPDGPWEPVFDDPIFLEKLENFLRAFAARYDGQPWVRYIDVGSIGDWGEGHLHFGSRKPYGYHARKKHIDLHLKYFSNTQIVVSDDFVYAIADPQERRRMHAYIVEQGLTYRDDSILVDWYITAHPDTWTVRSPEFFADVWRDRPTILELEHYAHIKRAGNWLGAPGSSLAKFGNGRSGADFFRGALSVLRATYIGYHGDAREWYADNPELTVELLNRCGYWYFPHGVEMPETLQAGRRHLLRMAWENRGVAPAYHSYVLQVRLVGPGTAKFDLDAGNRRWLPGSGQSLHTEDYTLEIPGHLESASYDLRIRLYSTDDARPVYLALDPSLLDEQQYYTVGKVEIESPARVLDRDASGSQARSPSSDPSDPSDRSDPTDQARMMNHSWTQGLE